MKIPFAICANMESQESLLEKIPQVTKIWKSRSYQKQTNIQCVVIHYSQTVHLTTAKASMVSTEVKIDCMDRFCRDLKEYESKCCL